MTIGFVRPDYPHERRVALLPADLPTDVAQNLVVERGFGAHMDESDAAYAERGCAIAGRDEVFAACDTVFSLKLIQPADYGRLRPGQAIVGWTHPLGSGREFFDQVARPLGLRIFDIDNITPRLYVGDQVTPLTWLPRNFIWGNSYLAGKAAVQHALQAHGTLAAHDLTSAVLGTGNVAQGAFAAIAGMGCEPRMFYRKTMGEFYALLPTFDVIVNGIEADEPGMHILNRAQLAALKRSCLLIDAAADAGNAIEGSYYTGFDEPLGTVEGVTFYCVNNAPSLVYRTASRFISSTVARWILPHLDRLA